MNIIEIESKDNKKIKELRKLKLKKYRNKNGQFLVENWKIIKDALKSDFLFEELFVSKSFLDKNKKELEDIFDKFKLEKLFLVADNINQLFSALDTASGVVAVYKKEETSINFASDIVYLNNIKDPGNLGTILRSGLAFGIENVVLDENCVDVYNPKTIQAAKDAIFKLNIDYDREGEIIGEIKKKMPIFITNVEKGKEVNAILNPVKNICILLGNESSGVSAELQKMADEFINIKITSKIESLNVAISAGIIFYELFKIKNKK